MSAAEDITSQREALWRSGYRPLAVYNIDARVNSPGKQPKGFAWQREALLDPPTCVKRAPDGDAMNTGVMANGYRVIDLDVDDQSVSDRLLRMAGEMLGRAPTRHRENSGRRLMVYRAAQGEPGKRSIKGAMGKVEVLGKGQQFVAYGKHPSGVDLQWDRALEDWPADELTEVTEDQVGAFLAAASEVIGSADQARDVIPLRLGEYTANSPTGLSEIDHLLSAIPADSPYDDWLNALMAVHAATGGSAEGLAIADNWSRMGSKYKPGEVEKKWASFRSTGVTGATLAALARDNGADLSAIRIAHMPEDPEWAAMVMHGREVARTIKAPRAVGMAPVRYLTETDDGTLVDQDGVVIDDPSTETDPPAQTKLDYPPGLVGDIAKWIVSTATKPQPAISIVAAITVVGCVAGRQFRGPEGGGTALYALALAPTAQGKDTPLKQIGRIMNAAALGHHLGPDEFMSFSSVVNLMTRRALVLAPMDEFGDFMRRVFDRKGSIHARAIPKVLRSLWGANFDQARTAEWADREGIALSAPHLSLFGASTHEQFYTALENGAVADGTLNRFLIVEGERRPKFVDPQAQRDLVPKSLIDQIKDIYNASGTMHASQRNNADFDPTTAPDSMVNMTWGQGAGDAWKKYRKQVEDLMSDDPAQADLRGRTAEMAVRIATIVAIGRGSETVDLEDLQYGMTLASRSADTMIAGAADFMAENDQEANWQKIARMIREKGGRLEYRAIYRSMKHMRSRDLKDLLTHMADSGVITVDEIKRDDGGHPKRWYLTGN
ncbi:PriCT-2 domain-containing protein [Fulvimarina sp. 2208YS6-2-32]|uniref:PriCT-2 domain-containing protein n=1 Tax=Fulvimarina uroteuthidis TaxID=3098149 RepID=A0ABU5HYT0_9HYPH|nr:PriCT-2 domain-containing protein [Fulvimarina sp. 2208YS6-2-32]MDY8108272.1 PriCT-2 domain-containing protein [Fulvimarina sp. 2208YS6-2-32]